MIDAIFFDIDGTLLNEDQAMPDSARSSLHALRQRGVKLFIATGRSPSLFEYIKELLDFSFDGYVLLNGQYCVVGDEVIHELWLLPASIEAVYPYILENGIPCQMVETDYRYAFTENKRFRQEMDTLGFRYPVPPVEDFSRIYRHRVYQLSVFIREAEEAELLAHMPGVKTARWSPVFTDVIPAQGGKAAGLQKMLDRFGLHRKNCMAIGDGGNDIEMLRFAGIGVAMGNAGADVKRAADYITDDVNEHGVRNALEKYGLL